MLRQLADAGGTAGAGTTGGTVLSLRVVEGPAAGTQRLLDSPFIIGRGEVDLDLADPSVSRRHARITIEGRSVILTDLGSAGGTNVDGERVQRPRALRPGDVVRMGESALLVLEHRRCHAPGPSPDGLVITFVGPGGERALGGAFDRLRIGRDHNCDIVVDDTKISRTHVEVRSAAGGLVVEDLQSTNGTTVNGRTLRGRHRFVAGDIVELGGAGVLLRASTTSGGPTASVAVNVVVEGSERGWAVLIDADGADTTVADVVAALREYLGFDTGDTTVAAADWTLGLYTRPGGHVLHPDDRWCDLGLGWATTLVMAPLPPAVVTTDSEPSAPPDPCRVAVNQLPRTVQPPFAITVDLPKVPDETTLRGRGVQWQMAGGLAAVFAGLLIAFVRPGYAVFALIGGVVGLVTTVASVLGEQSRRRHQVQRFKDKVTALDAELAAAQSGQAAARRAVSPDVEELAQWIDRRSGRLWERHATDADFLRLRLGTGSLRLRTDRSLSVADDGRLADELRAVIAQRVELVDVPVTSPGLTTPVIGIAGDRQAVIELTARLLIEAATEHAPHDLAIAVAAVTDDWTWARWLPHAEGALQPDISFDATTASVLASRLTSTGGAGGSSSGGAGRGAPPRPRFVVVGHGAMRAGPVANLVQTGLGGPGQVVVLADHTNELPSEADVVIEVRDGWATVRGSYADAPTGRFRVAGLPLATAEALAVALGRFTDPRRPPTGHAGHAGLLDLLGAGPPETADVESLWSGGRDHQLAALVGTADDGTALSLDLRRDGPHGLIAGTTGSGKSELLQTFLAALAVANSPARLNLFLIDFKGGATFAALARLPHVVGTVTDLEEDRSLADRAFTSLDAEITRRKLLLDRARCRDILEYERLPEAVDDPLPTLVVAIDEFALLVREQPEVKRRLDTIAAQGRSLGVHLILATQSPAGVITDAIRTNTNMWLCLRVVDESSSSEVLGRPDAARIPNEAPGRGFLRRGANVDLTGFQTARVARPVRAESAEREVVVRPYGDVAPSGRRQPVTMEIVGRDLTELDVLVNRIAEEFDRLALRRPRALWLPPLPDVVAPTYLPGGTERDGERLAVCLGLLDEPDAQRQSSWWVDLSATGNALVLGVLGSGKTTTLTQIGLDLAEHYAPSRVHIYGVEAGAGSLAALARLPHTAGVVSCSDRERLMRLFARLASLVEHRRERMASAGAGDFNSWRATRDTPEPWVVLMIDDYPALKEAADSGPGPSLIDQLASLAQNGPSVGVHVVLASTQATDIRVAFTNLFGARILLRQADPVDYHLLDLRLSADRVPVGPPGRATVIGGRQLQVAAPTDERVAAAASRWSGQPLGGPRPIERLPRDVRLTSVLARRPPARRELVIGVGGAEVDPVVVDQVRAGPHLLVMGDNQTGRSTALMTCYESTLAADPDAQFVILAPRPSPLRDLVGAERVAFVGTTRDEFDDGLALIGRRTGSTMLLIDDAEAASSQLSDALERELRQARDTDLRSCIAVRSADFGRLFEGWARYLQTMRTGLVLMPAGEPAFAFETRLPAATAPMSPGRGYLVDRGAVHLVQVALPMRGALP